MMRARFERFFFQPAAPVNLGAVRIALFGFTAFFVAREGVAVDAGAAAINWKPTSFFRLLPGPPGAGALRTIQIAAVVFCCFAALGAVTRITARVATPLAIYVLAFDSNFGKINHRSMLFALLMLALLPARTGDALSLDRLVRAGRERRARGVDADAAYRWPVALAQTIVVSVYVFAGLSKLVNGGATWFKASSFQRFLYVRLDQLPNPPHAGLWLAAHPGWAQATAIASVVFEFSVAVVLVWPLAKWFILPGLIAFHESTRAFTRIDFTRTLVAAWIPLLDYEKIGHVIRDRVRSKKTAVLYDGRCGLCRRSAAVLWTLDALKRLEFVDARDESALRARFPQVSPDAALKDMHVVGPDGRAAAGFYAYRWLAGLLPLGWIVWPFTFFPGVTTLGQKVYRRVADSRLPLLHCAGDACEVDHAHVGDLFADAGAPARVP